MDKLGIVIDDMRSNYTLKASSISYTVVHAIRRIIFQYMKDQGAKTEPQAKTTSKSNRLICFIWISPLTMSAVHSIRHELVLFYQGS